MNTPQIVITDSFDTDFGVGEWHGTNAFIRDGRASADSQAECTSFSLG